MASLRREIRRCLTQFLEEHENEESSVELLRMFQREAWLMQETEQLKDVFRSDPFECLKHVSPSSMNRLLGQLQVSDCHRVHTKSAYCHISATCLFLADDRMKSHGVLHGVELFFQYERQPKTIATDNDDMSPTVLYGISLARDHGASEKLLWVEVYTDGHIPTTGVPAINMMEVNDDEEEWEDMDEEDEEQEKPSASNGGTLGKRQRDQSEVMQNNAPQSTHVDQDGDQDMEAKPDRYIAGIDPDVLANFLKWTHLGGEMADDLNSFYFLMTFAFYETEFDLLGYLLEGVFGPDDQDKDNDQEK